MAEIRGINDYNPIREWNPVIDDYGANLSFKFGAGQKPTTSINANIAGMLGPEIELKLPQTTNKENTMDKQHEEKDIMSAQEIVNELKNLIESEKSENEPGSEADAVLLEEAVAKLEEFISAEEKEEGKEEPMAQEMSSEKSEPINTGVLTGPINNLKNFLVKKSQSNY
jgi:hypothetical protein